MTPDVNVLVAASRVDHPHHGRALDWLDDALDACAGGERMVLLPMVTAGFVRVVTHRRVFVQPTPIDQALAFVEALAAAPGVGQTPCGDEWGRFAHLCRAQALSGNDVADAWIAAAVVVRREKLVTFDRGFARWLNGSQLNLLSP